ncbi:MAG: hypothetical protein ACXAC8_07700 [Candidatus Hodarchaeales archaeon]
MAASLRVPAFKKLFSINTYIVHFSITQHGNSFSISTSLTDQGIFHISTTFGD